MARQVRSWVDSRGDLHKTEASADRADAREEASRLINDSFIGIWDQIGPCDVLNLIDNHADLFRRYIDLGEQMLKEAMSNERT